MPHLTPKVLMLTPLDTRGSGAVVTDPLSVVHVLVARRRSHGQDQRPIEYAVVYYRADRYRFTIDLVRE